jgi:hypothetical protein
MRVIVGSNLRPARLTAGEKQSMATLLHHQELDYRLPRIRGWDVSGDIAHTVAADYRWLVDTFGLEPPGVPFTVYVEPGVGSTYHRYDTTITFFVGAEDPYSASLTAAVMLDVFTAAAGTGWDGQATNGTALRHALAAHLHPELAPLMQSIIHGWWSHGAADYLASNRAGARDPDATGCGLLFLSYLHDGLGYSWSTIVQTGGVTLTATYAALTNSDARHAYTAFMQALTPFVDHDGGLMLPEHGNPWRTERLTDRPRTAVSGAYLDALPQ